jgi:hypothetical protein
MEDMIQQHVIKLENLSRELHKEELPVKSEMLHENDFGRHRL